MYAVTDLSNNAKALAKFLASANPYLPEATLNTLLAAHARAYPQPCQCLDGGAGQAVPGQVLSEVD
ncbi:hypothetical protein EMIT053CA3_30167 [Pseudomonas donghuensis]